MLIFSHSCIKENQVELKEICAKYIAFLRALYLLHQNHHWLISGNNFYGHHLLFERLYKSAQENADLAAEKFIGLFGSESIGAKEQGKLIADFLDKYTSENYVEASLAAERDFLKFSNDVYYEFKNSEGKMTLGLDDMIMSIASQREESVYLLQQTAPTTKAAALAIKFEKKLRKPTY